MSKFIVCTSINSVTEAVDLFDNLGDWKLIVVGDLKTPKNYALKNGVYLSPSDQETISKELSDLIGWNCIQRRNFGFIEAIRRGAEIVATVDDDNIPLSNWGTNLQVGKIIESKVFQVSKPSFDPIGATNYPHLWHRGFPLQLIQSRDYSEFIFASNKVDIQADFWNGDPDIDAICRLEHGPECTFDDSNFPFKANKISPFNSQNTFLSAEVLLHYFLFPHIGRMDDIWASFYVQGVGFSVLYERASVYQKRNEHDLIKDMKQEYIGYELNLNLIEDIASDPESIIKYIPDRTRLAWQKYKELIR